MLKIYTKGYDSMTRIIDAVTIYDGKTAKIVDVVGGEQVKIQAKGSGTYTLKGRLNPAYDFDDIAAIKSSDFNKTTTISDNSVWCADVSGYSQITVEADSVDEVFATIIG